MQNKESKEDTIIKVLELLDQGLSQREVARRLLGKDSKESTIRGWLKKYRREDENKTIQEIKQEVVYEKLNPKLPKIFLFDIECSATIAYVFGRFKAFVKPEQVIQEPYMLTFCGVWLDEWEHAIEQGFEPEIISASLPDYPLFDDDHANDILLISELWEFLDKADIVVAHNARFDKGWANQRFALHGLPPPSPYKVIDTLAMLKKEFSLPQNSLKAATQYFQITQKLDNSGWDLWIRCMNGDRQAFEEMVEYNKGDIVSLTELYLKIRPFYNMHPNISVFNDEEGCCSKCGSPDIEVIPQKYARTSLSKFEIYRCHKCGGISRGRVNQRPKEAMKLTNMNPI